MSNAIEAEINSAESMPVSRIERLEDPVRLSLTISELPDSEIYVPMFMDRIEREPELLLPALSEALLSAYASARPGLSGVLSGAQFGIVIEAEHNE